MFKFDSLIAISWLKRALPNCVDHEVTVRDPGGGYDITLGVIEPRQNEIYRIRYHLTTTDITQGGAELADRMFAAKLEELRRGVEDATP